MKKSENILIVIISFFLIAGIVMGVFAFFKRIDETLSDIEETETLSESAPTESAPTESEGLGDDDPVIDSSFYINESTNTGYHTVDNKTYFFRIYEYDSSVSNTLRFYLDNFSNFSDYVYDIDIYSINDYEQSTWTSLSISADIAPAVILSSGYDHTCYVSYTAIQNCENPSYVLEDLNQNVFFNTDYFEVVRDENDAVG